MPTGYKDTSSRYRLGIKGYKDVATRLRLQATIYKDAATRFSIRVPFYKNVASRFRMEWSGGRLRTWDGSAWVVPKQLMLQSGSFGTKPIKLWTGSRWATVLEANRWLTSGVIAPAVVQYRTSSCVLSDQIHMIGGLNDAPTEFSRHAVYDPLTQLYTTLADLPAARAGGGIGVISGKIYYVAGQDSGANAVSTLYEYTPGTDSWAAKTSMTVARKHPAAAVLNGLLYVVGGENSAGTPLNTMQSYDPGTNLWTNRANLPAARSGARAVAYNGKLYVVGGDGANNLYEYTTSTNTWATLTSAVNTYTRAAIAVMNGALFIRSQITERYDFRQGVWKTMASGGFDDDDGFGFGAVKDVLYVLQAVRRGGANVFGAERFAA